MYVWVSHQLNADAQGSTRGNSALTEDSDVYKMRSSGQAVGLDGHLMLLIILSDPQTDVPPHPLRPLPST